MRVETSFLIAGIPSVFWCFDTNTLGLMRRFLHVLHTVNVKCWCLTYHELVLVEAVGADVNKVLAHVHLARAYGHHEQTQPVLQTHAQNGGGYALTYFRLKCGTFKLLSTK